MGQTTSCFTSNGSDFLRAAKQGDYATAHSQLQDDAGLVATASNKGWTGLHYAAHHGDLKLIQDIIQVLKNQTEEVMQLEQQQRRRDKAAAARQQTPAQFIEEQVNRGNTRGQTPLMLACKQGHTAVVQLLLREGASALKEDRQYKKTCLHYAAKAGHHECLQLLLADATIVQSDMGPVALHSVRVQDASNITQRFVDARAAGGFTALHLASFYGRVEAVQALLAAGASLMATTYNLGHSGLLPCETGSTALHLAAVRGQEAVATAILEAHLQAMGTLGREDGSERFRWEGNDRLDPRMVRNLRRETPYRLALAFGHRHLVTLLDPSLPILWVLRPDEDSPDGVRGPPTLASLAAKALREHLVGWLDTLQVDLDDAALRQVEQKDTAAQQDRQSEQDPQIRAATPEPGSCPPESSLARTSPAPSSATSCSTPTCDLHPDITPHPNPTPTAAPAPSAPIPSPFATAAAATTSASHSGPPTFHHTHSLSADATTYTWAEATTSLSTLLHPPSPTSLHAPTPRSRSAHAQIPRFESLPEDTTLAYPTTDPISDPPSTIPIERRKSVDDACPPAPSSPVAEPGSPHFYTSCWFVPRSRNPAAAAARSDSLISPSTLEALLDPPLTTLRASPFLTSRAAGKDARGTPIVLQSIPRGTRLRINAVRGMVTLVRPVLHLTQRRAEPQPSIKGWDDGRASSDSDASDRECGICLDAPQQLAIRGCGHRLCLSCTKALCQDSNDPALCPFCRRFIGGFERIPLAPLPPPPPYLTPPAFAKDV